MKCVNAHINGATLSEPTTNRAPGDQLCGLEPPFVFVIDDEVHLRRILEKHLRTAGYRVETFASATEFLNHTHIDSCGCILLDIQMPGMSGVELQEKITQADYAMPIIFVTACADLSTCVKVMKKGAENFLTKPFDAETLLSAVSAAIDKDRENRRKYTETAHINTLMASLTPREHEVMLHLIAGKLNKQIAAELGIAEITVKVHRKQVLKKFGVASVVDLMRALNFEKIEA